jgi:hypothetical protein
MGDRGNIAVINKKWNSDKYEGIFLYSHWGGHRLERTARKAVANSGGRVGDPSYLTRIIFCNMIMEGFTTGAEGVSGLDAINYEMDPNKISSEAQNLLKVDLLKAVVYEFMTTIGYGISLHGAGDQNNPTVVVDADTGEIWTDEKRPTSVEEIIANRLDSLSTV